MIVLFARLGIAPTIRMEARSDEAIREAILAGLGIGIPPRYTPGLDPVLTKAVCLDVEVHLSRRAAARAEAKGVFRECLRGSCRAGVFKPWMNVV